MPPAYTIITNAWPFTVVFAEYGNRIRKIANSTLCPDIWFDIQRNIYKHETMVSNCEMGGMYVLTYLVRSRDFRQRERGRRHV
jgi:hypothetical protein